MALVVQMLDSTIQGISVREINCVIPWIEIYPVDSVIHLLNIWALLNNIFIYNIINVTNCSTMKKWISKIENAEMSSKSMKWRRNIKDENI